MSRQKIKCIKCGLRFNDRQDQEDEKIGQSVNKFLCWNCRFIWQSLSIFLKSMDNNPFMSKPLNRIVSINLDDVNIKRHASKTS